MCIRDRVEYATATSLFALLAVAPLRLMLGFGDVVARLCFIGMFRRRAIAIDNLLRSGLVQDSRGARRMALASFRAFVAMVIETNAARRRLTAENWPQHVKLIMNA